MAKMRLQLWSNFGKFISPSTCYLEFIAARFSATDKTVNESLYLVCRFKCQAFVISWKTGSRVWVKDKGRARRNSSLTKCSRAERLLRGEKRALVCSFVVFAFRLINSNRTWQQQVRMRDCRNLIKSSIRRMIELTPAMCDWQKCFNWILIRQVPERQSTSSLRSFFFLLLSIDQVKWAKHV